MLINFNYLLKDEFLQTNNIKFLKDETNDENKPYMILILSKKLQAIDDNYYDLLFDILNK